MNTNGAVVLALGCFLGGAIAAAVPLAHASREAPGFEAAAPEPSIGVPLSATDAALITFYKCGVRDQIITDQIDLYKRIGKTFVPPADKQCDAVRQFVADHGVQD